MEVTYLEKFWKSESMYSNRRMWKQIDEIFITVRDRNNAYKEAIEAGKKHKIMNLSLL